MEPSQQLSIPSQVHTASLMCGGTRPKSRVFSKFTLARRFGASNLVKTPYCGSRLALILPQMIKGYPTQQEGGIRHAE
jgi:hypothetical protein